MGKAQSRAVIDHLVFGCEQLETGTAYLERVIGKDFVVGGKHDLMTTHNKLLRLQGSVYLESIAIDFKAAKAKGDIGRKRWFSLDDTRTRQKLAIAPYPLTWVVAVDNVDEAPLVRNVCPSNPDVQACARISENSPVGTCGSCSRCPRLRVKQGSHRLALAKFCGANYQDS